ncbi:MAG: hypothetical protein MUC49_00705 [Raineya sp.]|nr:hypothetical protein [Raineya sp.]
MIVFTSYKVYFIPLIMLVLALSTGYAQKEVQVKITDENINTITDWRDLGSTKKLVNNRNWLRSMIKKLNRYEKYDSTFLVKLVDSIASLKMNESFCFLADFCCRSIDYSKKTELSRMAWIVNRYGGSRALNKYYLKDSIDYKKDPVTFHAEVYYAIRAKYLRDMEWCYYYKPIEKPVEIYIPKNVKKRLKYKPDCDSIFKINNQNINNIDTPWQFMFLNNPPITKLDTLVYQLTDVSALQNKKRDSLYFNNIVRQIVKLKTPESFCLVYNTLFRPIVIKDLNPFNSLCGMMSYYGGYQLVNEYYFNNTITTTDTTIDQYHFYGALFQKMKALESECYYCTPISQEQKMIQKMKEVDSKRMDRKVSRIIRKNSRLKKFGGILKSHIAFDSIRRRIERLKYVKDVFYDYCQIKIDLYPGYMTLGVLFTEKGVEVEKGYIIQVGRTRYTRLRFFGYNTCIPIPKLKSMDKLLLRKIYYAPNFIKKNKQICEDAKEQRRQYNIDESK